MGAKTGIQWTSATWNCLRGCSRVSEGCRNCYAEKIAGRFGGSGLPYEGLTTIVNGSPKWNGKIQFVEDHLLDPLRWKTPRRIFVNSMSDLFHEHVTDEMLDRIFAVMALSPQHSYQILTKRPERMLAYMANPETPNRIDLLTHIISAGRLSEISAPERTLDITGWPGYFITSKGRVLSDRTTAGTRHEGLIHELKLQYGEQGHTRVMVQVDGLIDRLLVHRVVLDHFDRIGSPEEQGCHIDSKPKNNALWNLHWGDQSSNWDDSKRNGTRRRYNKLSLEDVSAIRIRLEAGESASSIASSFAVSDTQIRNIASGKQWIPEYKPEWPLKSVWLGVSDEGDRHARIDILRQTPAAVRFISFEPLIFDPGTVNLEGISWAICGGESGPGARPMEEEWARSLMQQCKAAGTAFFMKQGGKANWKDYKDFDSFPTDLQVREFPSA